MTRTGICVALALMPAVAAGQLDLSQYRIVDLTHPFNAQTIYWPTSTETFKLNRTAFGQTPGGWFYSSNSLATPEHGGTHLDAPIHFSANGRPTDQVPLNQLIGPAIVIDISAKAAANRDYLLTDRDVREFERANGLILPGSIVLLRTGWSRRWPDKKAYLGDDTPGDASKLHFPSFGADAARMLITIRRVAALGADVASIDYGPSTNFAVHQLAGRSNVPGLENLTNLDQLPAKGATIIALPMKIQGGSGGPLRAVALVPK